MKSNVDYAFEELRAAILSELYKAAYDEIQGLGGPGLHESATITRADALRALNDAKNKVLDKK
jgi:hypothetical protein